MATIIDDNYQHNSASVWPTAIKYGLFIALAGIILQVIGDLAGINDYTGQQGGAGSAYSCLIYLVGAALLVAAVKVVRDQLQGGRISFGKAFGTTAATALIAALVSAVWTFIYFSFINAEAIEMISDTAMQNAQIDEDQEGAEQVMGFMQSIFTPGGMAIMSFFFMFFANAIIGLIVAAVMKKD